MRIRELFLIAFAVFTNALLPVVAASQTAVGQSFPPVVIKGSETRTLKSEETGRNYDLYIRRAGSAAPGKKVPVLYLLDGQWDFKLLDSVWGGLYYDKFVPDIVIVGITYSGENPNFDELRAMDYTPTRNIAVKGSGDAPRFLAFLKNKVMPLVESNYGGDPGKRILMGSSYGGLFTLYAMLTEPALFYGYVAASPAVSYDNNFLFALEKKYAETRKSLPARAFISVGDQEQLTQPVKGFIQVITGRGYTGFRTETRVIEGERHAGNKPEAFNRGLRFVFQD